MSKSCHVANVAFRTKHGKVVKFRGKTGEDCGPRKRTSTKHLSPYKKRFAAAAKACRGKGKKFRSCMRQHLK